MSTAPSIVTVGQYLAQEAASEIKHEYYYGQVLAMAGNSFVHTCISMNLALALGTALRGGPCRPLGSDQRVRTLSGNYLYPDMSVICGKPRLTDERPESLLNPVMVFEILSPSTEARDRGAKFSDYQTIPSLREYVLVSQEWQFVEHYIRQAESNDWLLKVYQDPTAIIQFPSAGVEFAMGGLYDNVEVPLHPRLAPWSQTS